MTATGTVAPPHRPVEGTLRNPLDTNSENRGRAFFLLFGCVGRAWAQGTSGVGAGGLAAGRAVPRTLPGLVLLIDHNQVRLC